MEIMEENLERGLQEKDENAVSIGGQHNIV